MDPREFYHRAERLHDDTDCTHCPPAMKRRCDNLPGDEHDLCTLIVYAKLDMEDDPTLLKPEDIIEGGD